MRLTFLGATHEVTGSCYYLEAAGKKFLVDCGMEQGPNIYENKPIPVPASQLDFVLITHAHIDHTGNLPLLYAHGFRGPIYMTPATVALSDIMLRLHVADYQIIRGSSSQCGFQISQKFRLFALDRKSTRLNSSH